MAPALRRALIRVALVASGLLILGAGVWWVEQRLRDAGAESAKVDAGKVARGRLVYEANCAECHGPEGEGHPAWKTPKPDGTLNPPPHDSSGHTWHHPDPFLYRIVREGGKFNESPGFVSTMPAFGDRLRPEEIDAALTYVKSLWGPTEREYQRAVTVREKGG